MANIKYQTGTSASNDLLQRSSAINRPVRLVTSAETNQAIGLTMPDGATVPLTDPSSFVVDEKTALFTGLGQTTDQVIVTLGIPAGSLAAGDVFRVMYSIGKDSSTDAYGTATNFRMGTTGTVVDSPTQYQHNFSSLLTGTARNVGGEKWFRVVSVGADSVVEHLGSATGASSFTLTSSATLFANNQYTLTGYNLSTQDGYFTITTTMAGAVTRPQSQFARIERCNSVARQEYPKTVLLSQSSAKYIRTGVGGAADNTAAVAYSFNADLTSMQIGDVMRFRTLLRLTPSATLKYAYLTMGGNQIVQTSASVVSQARMALDYEFWLTSDGLIAHGSTANTTDVQISALTPGVYTFQFLVYFSGATTDQITAYGYRLERE